MLKPAVWVALGSFIASFVWSWTYTVPSTTSARPLCKLSFDVPLSAASVRKALSAASVMGLPVEGSLNIEPIRSGRYLIRAKFGQTLPRTTVVGWKRIRRQYEEHRQSSQLLLPSPVRARVTAADIDESPGLRYTILWTLVPSGLKQTTIIREIVAFEQLSMRWIPMHLILPMTTRDEHDTLGKALLESAQRPAHQRLLSRFLPPKRVKKTDDLAEATKTIAAFKLFAPAG